MFVTALFIIAKNENSPNISQLMHKQKVVYSYNGIFDNKKNTWNSDTGYKMDGPWKHCAK